MTPEQMETFKALEDERIGLLKTKTTLEMTIGQKRLYANGKMLDARSFNIQRDAAKRRLAELMGRLQVVNLELKRLRRERNETMIAARGVDVQDPTSLISHAYNLLHRLACEGVEIDPQEQAVIDGLRHYLAHVRADPT